MTPPDGVLMLLDLLIFIAEFIGLVIVIAGVSAFFKVWKERGPWLRLGAPDARSHVPGHEGPCVAVWLSGGLSARLSGGVTGFFRRVHRWGPICVSHGPEFHGISLFGTDGKSVFTTADMETN